MSYTIEPGPLGAHIDNAFDRLTQFRFAEALWERRGDIWSPDPATQDKIANRFGWLDALDVVAPSLDRVRGFAAGVRAGGFTDVVLMGMGGSSLAPEVMHQTLGVAAGYPRFRMLDSVDPAAVREAMAHAATSLFLFASKSGTTIEPNVMAAEARRRVEEAGHTPWGSRFVAITDPDTALHKRAVAEQFRDVFVNPPDIGGRYSALSLFGIVPASLMGVDLDRLLSGARAMADACRTADPRRNPGLALGALMAAAAQAGRDKLTLLVPPRLASLGLWVEQLVAESTGKQGKGVVPITGESPGVTYGSDRAGVVVTWGPAPAGPVATWGPASAGSPSDGGGGPDAALVERLRSAGAPIIILEMPDGDALGGEFFRWEIATAAAGWLLGINPFDEPNVQQAKDATRAILDIYTTQKRVPAPEPHASRDGVRLTLSSAALDGLGSEPPERFLRLLEDGDYFGLLAYVSPSDAELAEAMSRLRDEVGRRTSRATMFGYGPRYLHSTGQLHKGGAPNGVFMVITATPPEDLPIPEEPFSFGVLETAQALGDFASLDRTGRRALLVQMPKPDVPMFTRLAGTLLGAL